MSIVPSLPYNLQNGTTADATQVMANFNVIQSDVNTNAAASGVNSDITALTALTVPLTAPGFVPSSTSPVSNGVYLFSANEPAIAANSLLVAAFLTNGSAVNFLQLQNAPTNNGPTLLAEGLDTNVNLNISSKAAGAVTLNTRSNTTQVVVADTPSAVDYVQLTGSATGNPGVVKISAQGTDSNINISLIPKGTGDIILNGTAFSTVVSEASGALAKTNNLSDLGSLATALTNLGFVGSFGANGYMKFPGGLIVQWGSFTTSNSGQTTLTFPTAFPTAFLSIAAILQSTTNSNISNFAVTSPSTTSIQAGSTAVGGSWVALPWFWIALGH